MKFSFEKSQTRIENSTGISGEVIEVTDEMCVVRSGSGTFCLALEDMSDAIEAGNNITFVVTKLDLARNLVKAEIYPVDKNVFDSDSGSGEETKIEPLNANQEFTAESTPSRRLEVLESGPLLHVPRFITGVVIETESGERQVQIDRDGLPSGITKIPRMVQVSQEYGLNSIILFQRVTDESSTIHWEPVEVFGKVGDTRAEIRALAYRSNTSETFSDEANTQLAELKQRYESTDNRTFMEKEATSYIDTDGTKKFDGQLVHEVAEYEHAHTRLDLRDREDIDIFTIDPDSARDFDDAISFKEIQKDGKTVYEIGVHIADVAHFLPLGSPLELDARQRQLTRYLKQITVPMLPEFIANTVCSLEPGEDRLAFSTIFTFDETGNLVGDPWFGRCLIKSKSRLTYKKADDILNDSQSPRNDVMKKIHTVTQSLRSNRTSRGAVQLDGKQEAEVRFDVNTGKAIHIEAKERATTSLMIEDLMLAANEAQGKYLLKQTNGELPLLFRAHEAPQVSELAYQLQFLFTKHEYIKNREEISAEVEQLWQVHDFCQTAIAVADEVGIEPVEDEYHKKNIPANTIHLLQDIAEKINDQVVKKAIDDILGRLLQKAHYTTSANPHFSLAVEPYLHATSPIRRYPDLIVQHLMDEQLRNRTNVSTVNEMSVSLLEEIATRANDAHIRARRAERDATTIAVLDYFEDLLQPDAKGKSNPVRLSGENAVVEGVNKKGIKVALQLPKGVKFYTTVPWEQVEGVEQDGEGNWMYDNKRDRRSRRDFAYKAFRPPRHGMRTLDVEILGVDRINRRLVTKVHRQSLMNE